MIKRYFEDSLIRKIRSFPVVVLLGARQSGKTTLIKSLLPDWIYGHGIETLPVQKFLLDTDILMNL